MKYRNEFKKWIQEISDNESPNSSIIAFWFGLFETTNGYTLYLTGSNEYDKNDDDWACNNHFEPSNKYFPLPKEYVTNKNWQNILTDSIEIVNEYLESTDFENSILKEAVAVAIGFDNGDLYRLK